MKKAKKIMLVGILMLVVGIIGNMAGGGAFYGILAFLGVFVCIVGRFME